MLLTNYTHIPPADMKALTYPLATFITNSVSYEIINFYFFKHFLIYTNSILSLFFIKLLIFYTTICNNQKKSYLVEKSQLMHCVSIYTINKFLIIYIYAIISNEFLKPIIFHKKNTFR